LNDFDIFDGGLAQLVERVLSMHEVWGSIPQFSIECTIFMTNEQRLV
jgi:hypothetical protein